MKLQSQLPLCADLCSVFLLCIWTENLVLGIEMSVALKLGIENKTWAEKGNIGIEKHKNVHRHEKNYKIVIEKHKNKEYLSARICFNIQLVFQHKCFTLLYP